MYFLYSLDTSQWTWTQCSNGGPPAREGAVLQYYNDSLYLLAGDAPEPDFYRFKLQESVWEDLTNANASYTRVGAPGVATYADYLYLFFGWKLGPQEDSESIYRVSLTDPLFVWEEVAWTSSYSQLARDSFGFASKGAMFYIFGGFTLEALQNSFVTIDLSQTPLVPEVIENYITPLIRTEHSLEVIYGQLYLFGGEHFGQKLNDFWRYDPATGLWVELKSIGDVPTPRSRHASCTQGDVLVIWGGEGSNGLLSDGYRYSVFANVWVRLEVVSTSSPSPRYSACIALDMPNLYIYGGATVNALSSEFWRYDSDLLQFQLLSHNGEPGAVHKHTCALHMNKSEGLEMHLMFGTGPSEEALGQIFRYSFQQQQWQLLYKSQRPRNLGVVAKVNDRVLVAGGETWGNYLQKDIFVIDLVLQTEEVLGSLEDFFLGGAAAYYGSYLYFHGGSNPAGTIYRPHVPTNLFRQVNLHGILECSPGTRPEGEHCQSCKAGEYSDEYSPSACKLCPAGFYNPRESASTVKQCLPCPTGTFNPTAGASLCRECPATAACYMGSKSVSFDAEHSGVSSYQPDFYRGFSEEAALHGVYWLVAVLTAGVLVAGVSVCFGFSVPLLVRLDLFKRIHQSPQHTPFIVRKNKMGGCCALVFYFVGAVIIAQTVPSFVIDGIEEFKTLLPVTIYETHVDVRNKQFNTNIIITVNLEWYPGPCTLPEQQCHETITFTSDLDMSLSCYEAAPTCMVVIECADCSVGSSAFVNVQLLDALSYASGISVNLTAFSSIPKEYSTSVQSVWAGAETVYRGLPATSMSYSMTSSLYISATETFTGYHVVHDAEPIPGNTITIAELGLSGQLPIYIELLKNNKMLLTTRTPSTSLTLFLITLGSSILGAFGIIEVIVIAVEAVSDYLVEKAKKKQYLAELQMNHYELKRVLEIHKEQSSNEEPPSSESYQNSHDSMQPTDEHAQMNLQNA